MKRHRVQRKVVQKLEYWVGIPIPSLNRDGKRLKTSQRNAWMRRALRELHDCFGAATASPAPGTNVVEGKVLFFEQDQILVWSLCKNRDEFFEKRDRIFAFADRMAVALNQQSVLVLGARSDSFLIEPRG